MRLSVLAGVLFVSFTFLNGVVACTVFVDNVRGTDTASGLSSELALRTLAAGVCLLKPGDILDIANTGTPYRESLSLENLCGEPGNPIVIEGHGAVLSGLCEIPVSDWEDKGEGLFFFPTILRQGALCPFLVDGDTRVVPRAASAEAVAPGEHIWTNRGVYYRLPAGMSLADCHLQGTMRVSGVAIVGGSHLTVRNLIAEYFANDGFNVHGDCRGLLFECIEGRWNGDDGFSIHEDVGAVVYGGWFHHNTFGIQDINASRSIYNGILSENNRTHGVHFIGGYHSLVDSVIRDNEAEQLRIDRGEAAHLGYAVGNPMCRSLVFLKNAGISGGRHGIWVTSAASLAATNCRVTNSQTGILASAGATVHLLLTAVDQCSDRELQVDEGATFVGKGNVYWPGRVQWHGVPYTAETFSEFVRISATDEGSCIRPLRASESIFRRLYAPMVVVDEYQRLPGPSCDLRLWCSKEALPSVNEAIPGDGIPLQFRYDFEDENPWCRVYPVPETAKDGSPVRSETRLISGMAHSGTKAMELTVSFPSERDTWLIKLFSLKSDFLHPVKKWEFWLRTDLPGLRVCPRVRDAQGEGFYGTDRLLEPGVWQLISWDLQTEPPRVPEVGKVNAIQDAPPLELVLDITVPNTVIREGLKLYADDLTVWLE